MSQDRNRFGGKNPHGGYTPMSEDEQEVLERLIASRDLHVHLVGWGIIHSPHITFGDLRVNIPIQITFSAPDVPVLVHYFDLELRTGSGILLFAQRQSTVYNHQPLAIGTGTVLTMVWHIAIQDMDPKLVKAIKPGAIGLTSRWIDRDTGEKTQLGNTRMTSEDRLALQNLRQWEQISRQDTLQQAAKATKKAGGS